VEGEGEAESTVEADGEGENEAEGAAEAEATTDGGTEAAAGVATSSGARTPGICTGGLGALSTPDQCVPHTAATVYITTYPPGARSSTQLVTPIPTAHATWLTAPMCRVTTYRWAGTRAGIDSHPIRGPTAPATSCADGGSICGIRAACTVNVGDQPPTFHPPYAETPPPTAATAAATPATSRAARRRFTKRCSCRWPAPES
jgi:hypothetical protein